jgi:hypothetical protein
MHLFSSNDLRYSGHASREVFSVELAVPIFSGGRGTMKRQWDIEELIEHFTLVTKDQECLDGKSGATLLGCALLLKCFQLDGRFPTGRHEIPKTVVDYVAHQLKVDGTFWQQYDWEGRTIKLHRAQIREHLEIREATVEDSESVSAWLITTHLASDQGIDHLKMKVFAEYRKRKIEPPTPERIERLIRSACVTYEHTLLRDVAQRLSSETQRSMDALLEDSEQVEAEREEALAEEEASETSAQREVITWHDLKTSPGAPGLESVFFEIDKLRILAQFDLPANLYVRYNQKRLFLTCIMYTLRSIPMRFSGKASQIIHNFWGGRSISAHAVSPTSRDGNAS